MDLFTNIASVLVHQLQGSQTALFFGKFISKYLNT